MIIIGKTVVFGINLLILMFFLITVSVWSQSISFYVDCHSFEGFWWSIAFFIVSLTGLYATIFRGEIGGRIYTLILVFFTFCFVSSFVFVSVLLPKHSAEETYKRGANGYWLNEYNIILQKAIGGGKWHGIIECYKRTGICGDVGHVIGSRNDGFEFEDFYIEAGCCNPPKHCGLIMTNETSWEMPQTGLTSTDEDCTQWIHKEKSCYTCNSCKAGYLGFYQTIHQQDLPRNIIYSLMLILLCALAYYVFHYRKKVEIKYWDPHGEL